MLDNGKWLVVCAKDARHQFGCADELGRHHCDGGDAQALTDDRIMQTAR